MKQKVKHPKMCAKCNGVPAVIGALCKRCYDEIYNSKDAMRFRNGRLSRSDKNSFST